jgi:hypothetical protein
VDQCRQEGANRFRHVSLLPVVPEGAVALMYLELIAELVSAARSARVGCCWGACGQKRRDKVLLVRRQVGQVEAGDHVKPREATTADECEVHGLNVTPATRGCPWGGSWPQRIGTWTAAHPARTASTSGLVDPYRDPAWCNVTAANAENEQLGFSWGSISASYQILPGASQALPPSVVAVT